MDPRTLQLIQRALVTAVTVVLALVVITAFTKVLEPRDEAATVRTTTGPTSTTVPDDETTSATTTTEAGGVTTTTGGATSPAVCVEPQPPSEGSTVLRVFFPCGTNALATGETFVYRSVTPTDLVLTTTMRQMVQGLEPEEAALGYRSPFPETATGSFLGVSISEGKAFLEFNATVFPDGVDTPEGAQIFLSALNANVFQFDNITEVEYRLGGSCDGFWQQLGGSCQTVTRAQWRAELAGG